MLAPSSAPFAVGDVISERYRIEALLGEGAMGAVYRVEHVHMRKRYALKVLLPEVSQNEEIRARFEREALAAAHIEHPNVVAATDFGRTASGEFFLVLEYVEGQSLRGVVEQGPLEIARVTSIAAQIGQALSKAHGMGIVHRDLKPENVMLVTRTEEPELAKVLDFGIAKVPVATLSRSGGEQVLTRMGAIFGTPEYMAPEQAVGDVVDSRADLYALGVILYELLTGVRPFDSDDPGALLSQHIVAPVPPMRERAPGVAVPPAVEVVIRKLLEKSASDRYASAKEAVAALEAATREPPTSTSQIAVPSGPRERWASGDESAATVLPGAGLTARAQTAVPGSSLAFARVTATVTAGIARLQPFLEGGAARVRPALEAARAGLPAPLRALPAAALGAAAVVAMLVPLLVFALILGIALRRPTSLADAGAPRIAASAPAPAGLSEERLRAAEAKGIEAVALLAREFPDDPRVPRAELQLHREAKRGAQAMEALGRLLALEPGAASEPDTRAALDEALGGSTEAQGAAFALLEGAMGEQGVDRLMERAAQPGPLKARCLQSLAKPEVRAHASPAAGVALDLRDARSCEARRALLERARDQGDERALVHLRPLTYTRGCGFLGTGDCWRCLRGDRKLEDAIRAIEGRRAR